MKQLLSATVGRAGGKYPLNDKTPFPGRKRGSGGAELSNAKNAIKFAYPNLMVPVTGRELAPAIAIDDRDSVAVASLGSSLSHSA